MIAFDTNLLVDAVDISDPAHAAKSLAFLKNLPETQVVFPWQVACEFAATIHRKRRTSDLKVDVPEVLGAWMSVFKLVMPTEAVITNAWRMTTQYQMSYFDAQLVAACAEAGAEVLYTQDDQSQPVIEGVKIINPFAS